MHKVFICKYAYYRLLQIINDIVSSNGNTNVFNTGADWSPQCSSFSNKTSFGGVPTYISSDFKETQEMIGFIRASLS